MYIYIAGSYSMLQKIDIIINLHSSTIDIFGCFTFHPAHACHNRHACWMSCFARLGKTGVILQFCVGFFETGYPIKPDP